MKIHNRHLSILILSGLFFFISCKKDKAVPKNNLAIPAPELPQEPGIYIPAKLVTGKSNMIFSYTATAALSKVNYENGDSTVLKFNADGKPVEFRRYEDGKLVADTYYSRNANGFVIKAQMYLVTGKDQVKSGSYSVAYDSGGQITGVSYYDKNNRLLEEQQYGYSLSGNLAAQKSIVLNANYSYDLKNGLFKHVGYAWLFALEKESCLFLSAINNIQECSYPQETASNQLLSYIYNTAGYPTTITITALGVTTATKVTYQ